MARQRGFATPVLRPEDLDEPPVSVLIHAIRPYLAAMDEIKRLRLRARLHVFKALDEKEETEFNRIFQDAIGA